MPIRYYLYGNQDFMTHTYWVIRFGFSLLKQTQSSISVDPKFHKRLMSLDLGIVLKGKIPSYNVSMQDLDIWGHS